MRHFPWHLPAIQESRKCSFAFCPLLPYWAGAHASPRWRAAEKRFVTLFITDGISDFGKEAQGIKQFFILQFIVNKGSLPVCFQELPIP